MAHLRPVPDPTGEQRRARLAAARLYLVCDCMPGERDLGDFLAEAIAGGVDVVQLREKNLEDEFLAEAASVAADVCDAHGALFILNDRPDIAAAVRADGVHVGQEDLPPAEARKIVGPDMLVGLSTHLPSEIDAALPTAPDGSPYVDYIGVGPVHATPTKLGRPPVGTELVSYASAHAHVPFCDRRHRQREHPRRARRGRLPRMRPARHLRRPRPRARRAHAARGAGAATFAGWRWPTLATCRP